MAQIDTTKTWVPGDSVDAAGMNNIIDQASALDGIITAQTPFEPATIDAANDRVLLHDASASALRKALVSALPQGATSVGLIANPTSVFGVTGSPVTGSSSITLSLDLQVGNKVLASPSDGSSGTPSFRVLVPADKIVTPLAVPLYLINWTLADYFVKILPNDNVARTLTLQNGSIGQVIKVRVDQGAAPGGSTVLTWTASGNVMWPGGIQPALSLGASHRDIYEFVCTGTETYFGIRWGANFS